MMGLNISRSVEIQISNKTRNIALRNPRTFFFSGHILTPPSPQVPPGSSSTSRFTNTSWFWGCNGVLAWETTSFTLAIYFSNPIDYNRFSAEVGLELSLDRVHTRHLEAAYDRLVGISEGRTPMFPSLILKEPQVEAQLSAGPVKVTVTMFRARNAAITVEVEERRNPGTEAKPETSCRARHVQGN